MSRLSPARRAELQAYAVDFECVMEPADVAAALDDIDDLTAQLAAKDAEIESYRSALAQCDVPETTAADRVFWLNDRNGEAIDRANAAEDELAALKAERDGGTISDEMVEAGCVALMREEFNADWENFKDRFGAKMKRDKVRAILTDANLFPGTRADGLRRAAEIAAELKANLRKLVNIHEIKSAMEDICKADAFDEVAAAIRAELNQESGS